MGKNNYYEWLELPVEIFEDNPDKLKECLEKKLSEWRSAKTMKLQDRAAIHEKEMREAIADSRCWKKLYDEYKSSVDAKILESLKYIGNEEVSEEEITLIADNQKISVSYAQQVAKEKGYTVGAGAAGASPGPRKRITLKDLEPAVAIRGALEQIQKQIEELGFADIAELVNDQIDGSLSLAGSSKEDFVAGLIDIKKKWDKKSATNSEVSQKKSYYNKICVGMINFWKKNDIADYQKFMSWRKVSQILTAMNSEMTKLKLDALVEAKFNGQVDKIYSVLGKSFKRDDAKCILETFCDEKKLAYPRPLPKLAACPYCKAFFEKTDPIQAHCPICGKSLTVKCPKCNIEKNLIADSVCDGVDLLRFPFLKEKLENARSYYDRMALRQTNSILSEIEAEWSGYPGVSDLKRKCDETERVYGKDLKAIEKCLEERKLHKAKEICDKLIRDFPAAKLQFESIYKSLEEVKKILNRFQNETDSSRRRIMLREMLNIVSDDPAVNLEMPKVEAVEGLTVRENYDAGALILSWKSQNEPNSVDYHIIRKRRGQIANSDDGGEVGQTQDFSFSDTDAEEGEAYYYAVYASMGSIKGILATTSAPVILLRDVKMDISPKDGAVDVTWPEQQESIKAFYSETKITVYGQGQEIPNVTKSGFYLEHLDNGKTYYLACFKIASFDGKEFRSAGSFGAVTPLEDIAEPEVAKSMGSVAGEYIITLTNPQRGVIFQLYYGSSAITEVPLKRNVDIAFVQRKLKKLDCKFMGEEKYSVHLSGQNEIMVYPVHSKGSVAIVGKPLNLKYIKPIRIKEHVITGNTLNLVIESWPDGVDALLVCYNDDYFPEDKNDAQSRIVVSKNEYDKTPLLEIPDLKKIHYYIAIFARRAGEYIPICNYEFDNRKKERMEYSFSRNLFGKVSITIKSSNGSRPELYFVVTNARIPLQKTDGMLVATYPAVSSDKLEEKLAVSGFSPTAGSYGKLFTDDKSYELVLTGSSQLK